MALYEYRCMTCESTFELRRPMSGSNDPAACPSGHVGAKRMLSVFANVGGGRFVDGRGGSGPDFWKPRAHRGCAFGDFDNDGRVDVVVSSLNEPAELLRNVAKERTQPLTGRILRIVECPKTLKSGCKVIGIPAMRHHDLRHLFATRCIESGVDIPTVAKWLGHKDGGGLAMRVYGHLRNEHSRQMAEKVKF